MIKKLIMSSLLGLFALSSAAASEDMVNWKASWIWQKEDGPANGWVAFRKAVNLQTVPEKAIAYIAADSKYWIWVNGEMVQFEGGIARGPNPSDTYYETIDLGPFLKKGDNTVAVLVWYFGRTRKSHLDSGRGGLILQADIGGVFVKTDKSWKHKMHPAYDPNSGGGGNERQVPQYHIAFDGNKAMGDWTDAAWYKPGYDDATWESAVEKGIPPAAPWNQLIKNEVPLLKDHGLQFYENYPASKFPFVWPGGRLICKLPFNKQVTPYMEIETTSGQSVKMRVDNPNSTVFGVYTTRDGPQAFESYTWMNGHEVAYLMPRGVKVKALKYRWTGVGEMPGTFKSSDPFLNRLWWMARNTLYVCARDTFMDCPDRERGLWIGDVADQAGAIFYTMDEAGRKLLKKAIDQTVAFSKDGVLAGLAPGYQDEFVMQSLQFIPQGIWHYYYNTGDITTLENAYPAVRSYLNLFTIAADGSLSGRENKQKWPDWGPNRDTVPIEYCWYYMANDAAAKMARLLNRPEDTAIYEQRMLKLKPAFNRMFWNGKHYTSGKLKDDRLNALAILSGLADPERYEAIVTNVLIPERNASPHMEWIVQEAMIKAGYLDEAIERMKARYAPQVELEGRTTLDEYMGVAKGGTYNHAWNAPNYVLSRYIAGIAATETGWKKYAVLPRMAHLTAVKQVVPSVLGDITMEARLEDQTFTMDLVSPDETTAVVGIPKESISPRTIEANGVIIWKDGTFMSKVPGISWKGDDELHLKFEVAPGTWKFVAKP